MNTPFSPFRTPRARGLASLAGALALLWPCAARAQTPEAAPPPPPPADDALQRQVASQKAAIDALVKRANDQDRALEELRQQVAASDEPATKLLSFWGFSDLTFGGIHYDSDSALYKVATPYNATFYSSGINLYAKSEMTRTLSALVETRLTYTPTGAIPGADYPTAAYVGSTKIASDPGAQPANAAVHGPYSQLTYQQNGLSMERAYLEWRPEDWFGVRTGLFLTPFGIWNEDHGSPVLIGVDYPQFMNFNLVPLHQLGIEVFGSTGLDDDLRLEYALTLANSNGPAPEYKDLAEMKAVGARAKLVYTHDDLYFRIGGYAYYSPYVSSTDTITLHLTPTLLLDGSYPNPAGDATSVGESFDEAVFTGDLDVRFKRFRFLGELAAQRVVYSVPPTLDPNTQIIKNVPFNVNAYDASHYGYGGYVMAAYEVPFHVGRSELILTPYLGYDYVVPTTTAVAAQTQQVRGGLNFKPSPYVTLKVEVSRILPQAQVLNSAGTAAFSQVAFSF